VNTTAYTRSSIAPPLHWNTCTCLVVAAISETLWQSRPPYILTIVETEGAVSQQLYNTTSLSTTLSQASDSRPRRASCCRWLRLQALAVLYHGAIALHGHSADSRLAATVRLDYTRYAYLIIRQTTVQFRGYAYLTGIGSASSTIHVDRERYVTSKISGCGVLCDHSELQLIPLHNLILFLLQFIHIPMHRQVSSTQPFSS
jgi:hypothetical protein